jgi:anti-sigma regulatory factor (Ser/Thr protein kinase)
VRQAQAQWEALAAQNPDALPKLLLRPEAFASLPALLEPHCFLEEEALASFIAQLQQALAPLQAVAAHSIWLTRLCPHNFLMAVKPLGVHAVLEADALSTTPLAPQAWEPLQWLLAPQLQAPVLPAFLHEGTQLVQHHTITSSDTLQRVFEDVVAAFKPLIAPEQQMELSTALLEALTNAVYHAHPHPANPEEDKYPKGAAIESLLPSERVDVTLHLGKTPEGEGLYVLSITDYGGRLTPQRVTYCLERNISGEGLLDTSGRGLFLMYSLMDALMISIKPNTFTHMVLAQRYGQAKPTPMANASALKPLLVRSC